MNDETQLTDARRLEKEEIEDLGTVTLARGEHVIHCLPCLLYTSPSPRDRQKTRIPSSA